MKRCSYNTPQANCDVSRIWGECDVGQIGIIRAKSHLSHMRRKSHMRPNATYVSRITYQCDVRAIFNFSNLRTYVRYVKCKMRRMCESRGPTYVSLRLNRNICSICVSYLKRDVSTIVTISHLCAICKMRRMCESRGPTYVSLRLSSLLCVIS